MSRNVVPLPVPVEEPPEDDCPRCPPAGAPAWMATFADIATLLMAFFVLILSFAEFNQPKFKMVAGSLRFAFGIQRDLPVIEQPKGTTVLDLEFSPSPEMAVTETLTQQTTETRQPEIDQAAPDGDDGRGRPEAETAQAETAEAGAGEKPDPLAQAMREAVADAAIALTAEEGSLVMKVDAPPEDLPEELRPVVAAAQQALADQPAQGNRGQSPERSAAIAEAELRVALRREIAEGLVTVEQRKQRVFLTVGAGGAFASGEAVLTPEARDIMARLAFSAMNDASTITVTGHTDSVPLGPASPFGDNWGLAAARSSAVVRELAASGLIDPARLSAVSLGETTPVADNATEEGRERNRRIEIEINY